MQSSFSSSENPLFSNGSGFKEPKKKYVPYNNITKIETKETEELSYDDIFNALNVRLNQGKLQALSQAEIHANKRAATIAATPSRSPSYIARGGAPRIVPKIYNGLAQKQYTPPPPPLTKTTATNDSSIQHSYIYNKYFKDHIKHEKRNVLPAKPMNRLEYLAYLRKKAWEDAKQRARISEIKSQKLLFNNGNNSNIHISTPNSGHLNRMFKLKGI
jgi:hypothetical protein